MKYTNEHLRYARDKGVFSDEQVDSFTRLIENDFPSASKFLKVLFYGGGLIIMSALTWLLKSSWDDFGAAGILIASTAYLIAFITSGFLVYRKNDLRLPGGMLLCVGIAIVPLFVFSVMRLFGFWPVGTVYDDFYIWIKGKWIVLELSATLVAAFVFYRTRFPFIVFLVSFALWFMSMDIVPIIYSTNGITWTLRSTISQIFGVAMLALGYLIDIKSKRDYSFWIYLFGLLTTTSGFSVFYNDDAVSLVSLLLVHLSMIFLSLFLDQVVFIVFGVIGVTEFLTRISYVWFKGSPIFPFLLTVIGILLIVTGIIYQRNRHRIDDAFLRIIPTPLRRLRPKRLY